MISPVEKRSKEVAEEEEVKGIPEEEVDEEVDVGDADEDVDLVAEFVHDSGVDVDELIDQVPVQ